MAKISKKKSNGKKAIPMFLVQSKLKEYIASQDCRTAGDAVDALSLEVAVLIDKAVERTKANGRSTVKATDF